MKNESISFLELSIKKDEENIQFQCNNVNDTSNDASHTIAHELENQYENEEPFNLSRNFASHYLIFAGFTKIR
jgi:hypothetical protein